MKFIKYLFAMIFSIAFLVVLSIQGIYVYKVSALNLDKTISSSEYSQEALDTLWVSMGERNKQKIDSIGPMEFLIRILALVSSEDAGNYKQAFPSGFLLASHVAKNFVIGKTYGNTDWHLSNVVSSIWVSKNYSAKEALNYQLSRLNFGYGKTGLESAATFYFGKAPSDLNEIELITLVMIAKAPSSFSPYCQPGRLEKGGKELAKSLVIYNPSRYSSITFKVPDSVVDNGVICH